MARTHIGNIKGPKGDTGATGAPGATGAAGAAASIEAGTVQPLPYGNAPTVENAGTAQNAVFNFGIPEGKPATRVTSMDDLTLNSVVTSSDLLPVPAVGDNGKTIFGKIAKWFADMASLVSTKFDANKVTNANNTTNAGYALDARHANPNVSGSLAAQIPRTMSGVPYIIEGRNVSVTFTEGVATITLLHSFTSVVAFIATPVGAATNTAAFIKVKQISGNTVQIIDNNMTSGSSTLNPASGSSTINYIAIGY